jgi:uncharacterized protein YpiB (UPF0302 family)
MQKKKNPWWMHHQNFAREQTHVVIQQIISHQKNMFQIMFVECIPMGHSNAIHVTMDMHSRWTINNDHVHRKLD